MLEPHGSLAPEGPGLGLPWAAAGLGSGPWLDMLRLFWGFPKAGGLVGVEEVFLKFPFFMS